jgi:hypothetical protein
MAPDLMNHHEHVSKKFLVNREFSNLKIGDYVDTKEYDIHQDLIILEDDMLGMFEWRDSEHKIITVNQKIISKDEKRYGTKIS